MEIKRIITGDFQDEATGVRFLEDTEGRLHCMSCMWQPTTIESGGSTTINNYYTNDNPYVDAEPVILYTTVKNFTWPSITDFNRINNIYTGGFFSYTTPIDKELHLASLVLNQTEHGSQLSQHSIVGLYRAGNLILTMPVVQELNFKFFTPLVIPHSTYVELKYKPFVNTLQFSATMIGYLI